MLNLTNKLILNTILLLSIFSLFSAYYIQYILDFEPCNLCLYQRFPYFLSIIVITIGMVLKKFEKIVFILLSVIFLSATILSFYHFGIEQGFFEESFVCELNNEHNTLSKDELLKILKEKTVNCKDVAFRVFGLSLASINTIVSLFLSIIVINKIINYEKN